MEVALQQTDFKGYDFYRVNMPLVQLRRGGYKAKLAKETVVQKLGDQIVRVSTDADVLVFPRAMTANALTAIRMFQDQGVACVVDMDDDLSNIPGAHKSFKDFRTINAAYNYQIAQECADAADWVTVTTDALVERYGAHGRVSKIPNYVPSDLIAFGLQLPKIKDTVGWGGRVKHHPFDMQQIGGGVAQAFQQLKSKGHTPQFLHLGQGDVDKILGLNKSDYKYIKETPTIERYLALIGRMEIGVVPLEPNKFNESKSWLKMMEFFSSGTPVVFSPTPANLELHNMYGAGIPARRARDWRNAVVKLMSDEVYWQQQSDLARQTAAAVTIDGHYQEYWDAWTAAYEHRNSIYH